MVEIVLNYLNHCKIILGIFILTLVIGGILCFSFCQQEHTVDSSIGLVHEPNILKEEVVEETYVYVDIKGAVKKPGVYKISNQARVNDVVKQAGGLLKTADVTYTNLSKRVVDEMTIYIYTSKEIKNRKEELNVTCHCPTLTNDACISDSSSDKKETISINRASKEEFLKLTGIGEVLATKIVTYREEHGAFETVEAIKNVSGIGDALYQKIKDSLTL